MASISTSTQTPKPSLLTLPPEILLQIFTYLSSSVLYALSQTSKPLAKFLNFHAPTICNNLIQSNPLYFRASLILKSAYIDGWLVPQHHAIFEAEEQWRHEIALRERISGTVRSQCLRLGRVAVRDCCFRSASVDSNTTVEERAPRFASQNTASLSDHRISPVYDHNDPQQPLLSPPSSHQTPITSQQASFLPFNDVPAPSTLSLLTPGPQYLCFLQRYAHDIVTRWFMDLSHTIEPKTPTIVRHSNFATQLGPIAELEDLEEEMERMELAFASMVGVYCVRGWLGLVEEKFGLGTRTEDGKVGKSEERDTKKISRRSRMKKIIGQAIAKSKTKFKNMVKLSTKCREAKEVSPKRMLFGEIDAESAASLSGLSTTVFERENWVKGLLWYHGVATRFANDQATGVPFHGSEKGSIDVIVAIEPVALECDEKSSEEMVCHEPLTGKVKPTAVQDLEDEHFALRHERRSVRMLRRKWLEKLKLRKYVEGCEV